MLRTMRQDAKVTQAELAEALGKPQSYVSKVERGERIIDLVEVRWWCRELNADVNAIVRDWNRRLN